MFGQRCTSQDVQGIFTSSQELFAIQVVILKKTLAKTAKPFQGSKKLPCSKSVIKIQQIEATHRSHEHISLNVFSLICFLYHPFA